MPESPATTESSAPSEPVAQSDAPQSEPRSADASQESSPNLWQRLFGAHPKDSREPAASTQDATPTESTSPKTLTLTEEELDRRIQAETDRREAKRRKDALSQAEQDRRAAVERKLDPSSPEYDPYAGTEEQARIKAEDAANTEFVGLLQSVGQQHDASTLDVIRASVPQPEWDRILKLEGAGVGLQGRKLIMTEALKSLEKHWRAEGAKEAEAKLRGNQVFRKQVFAEHRGTVEEPELLPAGGSSSSGDFMQQVFADYRHAKGRG